MSIESINPATGEVIESFEPFTQEQIDAALDRAQQAFSTWRTADYDTRATLVLKIAETLRAQKERLAKVITLEMGKPIAEAEAEVEKCAWNCEFYADEGEALPRQRARPFDRAGELRRLPPAGRWCWRSCRGTTRCGRSSVSRGRRSWLATSACSSMHRT